MSTRGSRAIVARERLGLSQYKAAKLMGISAGALSKFERDEVKTSNFTLKMAEVYKVSPHWIEHGQDISGISIKRNGQETFIEDLPNLSGFGYFAPLFKWEDIKKIPLSYKELYANGHDNWVTMPSIGGSKTFAFKVEGYSMANNDLQGISFQPGDIVFFDKEIKPYDDCFVACLVSNDNKAIFRQYVKDSGAYWLAPLNKKYPAIKIDKALSLKILGVLIHRGTDALPPERADFLNKKINRKLKN